MLGHATGDSRAVCPICHKVETPKHQDLLCDRCIHNNIEIIRNSVVSNDLITSSLRQEINRIFDACGHSPEIVDATFEADLQPRKPSRTDVQPPLNASPTAVKSLSLQLRRLDIYNAKRKIQSIDHSKVVLEDKVADLSTKLKKLEMSIGEKERALTYKQHKLTEQYETELTRKRLEVNTLRTESISQIVRQSIILHKSHYTVIRDLIFNTPNRLRHLGLRLPKPPLLLFDQPVVKFSLLLANNSKIDTINTFIENLIKVLVLFKELFFYENPEIFPYLTYLESLLPDERFYTSVQEKIAAIRVEAKEQTLDEKNLEPDNKDLENSESETYLDKVVIKNNAIKIPISSRTANINRRASVKEPEGTPKNSSRGASPNSTLSPEIPDKKISSGLEGKKIVIVPHKILTRPFTKLKSKEYLRFVLILVKILLTFNTLLSEINTTMPPVKLKHSRSMMDTLNNLRTNAKPTEDAPEEFLYDIEIILSRIANLDDRFRRDITLYATSLKGSPKTSSNPSFADLSFILTVPTNTSINGSLVNIQHPEASKKAGTSNIYRIYSALVNKNRREATSKNSKPIISNDDINVYGMISETHSSDTSRLSLRQSGKVRNNTSEKKESYDIKSIMKVVNTIICDGDVSKAHSDLSTKISRTETISMLAHSKAQLEDWDMVSHMY